MTSSSTSLIRQPFGPRLFAIGVLALALQVAFAGCQQIRELVSRDNGSVEASVPPMSPSITDTGKLPQPKAVSDEKSDSAFATARALERSRKLEKAATAYQEILDRNPDCAPAHHRLAVVCERLGQEQLARQHFESALSLAPQNCDLLCDYGYSRYLRDDLEVAEQKLHEALDLEPGLKRAHLNLALVEACTGREREALGRFRTAGCNESEARANLAYGLMKVEKWPQAAEQLQLALSQNPNSKMLQNRMQEIQAILASTRKSKPEIATTSFTHEMPASQPLSTLLPTTITAANSESSEMHDPSSLSVDTSARRLRATNSIATSTIAVQPTLEESKTPTALPANPPEVTPASFEGLPVVVESR